MTLMLLTKYMWLQIYISCVGCVRCVALSVDHCVSSRPSADCRVTGSN